MPMRWLAGNTHKLQTSDWSIRLMGKVIDLLEEAMITISNDGSRMLSNEFMMSIFQSLKDNLPEFAEFMDFMFEHKETPTIIKNESNLTDF